MKDVQEYFRAATADEAVSIKRRYGNAGVYLAGGTDLMVNNPRGVVAAIDVRHAGIDDMKDDEDAYWIGGAALLRDAERHFAQVAGGMLGKALRETAPWLIRNAATVTGNVVNASPAADAIPALIALDAELVLQGDGEERAVSVADVLTGPHSTSIGDDLVRWIRIPRRAGERSGHFTKLARSASDIAQVNIAVALHIEGGVASDVRIVLGAVAPTTMRARSAEALLEGKAVTNDLLQQVQEAVANEVRPISDWRASAEYRRRMSGVLARRALQSLMLPPQNGDMR